jgi:translation initiation factor 3 subunit D
MALLLNIFDNPSGWGPGNDLPDAFKAIPFAPFNKADKVGKVLDWEQQQPFQQRGGTFLLIMNY